MIVVKGDDCVVSPPPPAVRPSSVKIAFYRTLCVCVSVLLFDDVIMLPLFSMIFCSASDTNIYVFAIYFLC